MATAAVSKRKAAVTSKLDVNLRETNTSKVLHLDRSFVWC
jgi:hypothetical protein